MQLMNKQLIIYFGVMFFLAISCYALTMTRAHFGEVLPGERKVMNILVGADIRDNTYVMNVEGLEKDWVEISPKEIFVKAKYSGQITVVLNVPENINPGSYSGLIVADGKKTIGDVGGGASTGYVLQVKTPVSFTVVTSKSSKTELKEKVESVNVLDLTVNKSVIEPNEAVGVTVKIINTGTVKTSAVTMVEVSHNSEVIKTLSLDTVELNVVEEKDLTAVWDTTRLEEGDYELKAYAKSSASGEKAQAYGPVKVTIKKPKKSNYWWIVLLILFIAIIWYLYSRKNKRSRKSTVKPLQQFGYDEIKQRQEVQRKLKKLQDEESKYRELAQEKEKEMQKLKQELHYSPKKISDIEHLVEYMKKAKAYGHTSEYIEKHLLSYGWPKHKIEKAFRKLLDELK